MTIIQAFEKIAENDAQLKKALGEIRKKIDEQTELIEQLKATELTPQQETIANSLGVTTQALDDIIPDPPTPPTPAA